MGKIKVELDWSRRRDPLPRMLWAELETKSHDREFAETWLRAQLGRLPVGEPIRIRVERIRDA